MEWLYKEVELAYSIDYTAHYYRRKRVRVFACVVLFLILIAVVASLVERGYEYWKRPTLAQKLSLYRQRTRNVEPLLEDWKDAREQYSSIAPYYELYWTRERFANLLASLERKQSALPDNLFPSSWTLNAAGDESSLRYELNLAEGSRQKRQQCENAVQALKSMLSQHGDCVVANSINVQYLNRDLLGISKIPFTVTFKIKNNQKNSLPEVPATLKEIVEKIKARRSTVLECKLENGPCENETIRTMLVTALNSLKPLLENSGDNEYKQLYSKIENTLDPGALLDGMKKVIPEDANIPEKFQRIVEYWEQLSSRRLPGMRFRELDNKEFAAEIESMESFFQSDLGSAGKVFQEIVSRVGVLRKPLLKGYSEIEVFDEGVAQHCIEKICNEHSLGTPRQSFERKHEDDDLILAEWEMRLGGEDKSDRNSRSTLPVSVLLDCIVKIPAMQNGFQIARVNIELGGGTDADIIAAETTVSGILPVRKTSKEAVTEAAE